MRVRIPSNLDIQKLIEDNGGTIKSRQLQKMWYICHSLISSYANHRDIVEDYKNPYVPLSSAIMQDVMSDYATLIGTLIDLDVIESDNQFIVGEKCYGYRFTTQYRAKFGYQNITDYVLKKAIKKQHKNLQKRNKESMYGYSYLSKWWNPKHFVLNNEAASKWLKEYKSNYINNLLDKYRLIIANDYAINKIPKEELNVVLKRAQNEFAQNQEKAEFMLISVEKLLEGNYFMKVDDIGKRLHTNLTNIKKELRNFLTYKGNTLVSIDIKNSQPYLSLALFKKDFWTPISRNEKYKGLKLEKIDKEIYKEIRKEKRCYSKIITLLDSLETQSQHMFQLNNFSKLVIGGQIYEYLLERWANMGIRGLETRDKVKVEVLRIMYHNPKISFLDTYAAARNFGEHFTVIYELYQNIKMTNYERLAHLMQKIESHLVLNVICGKVADLNDKVPLFTIHDSIVTTEQYQDKVKSIVIEELSALVGYPPRLTIEKWKPEIAFNAIESMTDFGLDDELEELATKHNFKMPDIIGDQMF